MSNTGITGTCRFCHQTVMVEELPEGMTRDEAATRACTCPVATEYRDRLESVESAKVQIQTMFAESEIAMNVLMAAVPGISEGKIDKVSVTISSITKAHIFLTSKGKIKILKEIKKQESSEI